MASEFSCEIHAELTIPDFMDASVPLSQIAEKVKTDSQKSIRSQIDINGSPFQPLSRKTIQDKIREKSESPKMALYRKGIMYRAIHVYKLSRNNYEVGIMAVGKPRRDLIGIIQQEVGPVIRRFLGFTPQTYAWAVLRIQRWISEKSQRAAKKYINLKY